MGYQQVFDVAIAIFLWAADVDHDAAGRLARLDGELVDAGPKIPEKRDMVNAFPLRAGASPAFLVRHTPARFGAVRVCDFVTKGAFARRGYNGQVQAHQRSLSVKINHAILHILDFDSAVNVMSERELDFDTRAVRSFVKCVRICVSRTHECGQSACGVLGRKRLRR